MEIIVLMVGGVWLAFTAVVVYNLIILYRLTIKALEKYLRAG